MCHLGDYSLRSLFAAFLSRHADLMIEQHVNILGKLPPDLWQKRDARLKWFNEEGARINGGNVCSSWEERFEFSVQMPRRENGMEEIGEEEKAALLNMLKAMMAFKPGDRMTAEQIKESEWTSNGNIKTDHNHSFIIFPSNTL